MRVLILIIALLAYTLPAVACDYDHQAAGSSTTAATGTPPSSTSGSGG
jgi:hypothetical protein